MSFLLSSGLFADTTPNTWVRQASMIDARTRFDGAATSTTVVAPGGNLTATSNDDTAVSEAFDIPSETWSSIPNMPTSREQATAVSYNDEVYVLGGDTSDTVSSAVEKFNPSSGTWTTLTGMPTGRQELRAAVIGDKIHVVGGQDATATTNVHEVYDIPSDSWSTSEANYPIDIRSGACVSYNGSLFYFGGIDNTGGGNNDARRYDPGGDAWTSLTSMPTNLSGAYAGVVGGVVYLFQSAGGFAQAYDIESDSYSSVAQMPGDMALGGSATVGNEIYAFGGEDSGSPVDSMYKFTNVEGESIPPSVVAQYYGTTWTQGDATWVDDVDVDGAQDISLTGDPQAVTLSDGSEALAFDGTNDYGLHDMPIDGSDLINSTLELSVSWTHTRDEVAYGLVDSVNSMFIQFRININGNFASDPGNFFFRITDLDGNVVGVELDNPNLNDGNRHDISIRLNDTSANDLDVIIDGSVVSTTIRNSQNPDNFGQWNNQIAIGAGNNAGTINHAEIDIGAVRWHDSAIDQQTISEY